ncbi:MAG TPA: alpha/beta hydrolase [Vicinamibacterales bacterium]|nr:alpha/beta hydrolase [Vicinamibacterales bacterium]
MSTFDTTSAIARLAQRVLSVRPLVDVLPGATTIRPSDGAACPAELAELFSTVTALTGAQHLRLAPSGGTEEPTVFEEVISRRIAIESFVTAPLPDWRDSIDQLVTRVIAEEFDGKYRFARIVSADGAPLNVYAGPRRGGKAVVLCPPCGMPAKLCERWMELLAADFFVMTWESRGLFGPAGDFDTLECRASAHVDDLFAVLDHCGVEVAHLAGLCGGAVIALKAAAERPSRVSSVSVWHGDYELGGDSPKTTHQQDLQALLSTAASGREQAASLQRLFVESMFRTLPADVAHMVLYPYATPELFYRYAKLNGDIMTTNIGPYLAKVTQPSLVVTSLDDNTTHPAGSAVVSQRLQNALLHVEPHGDHLSLFGAPPALARLASRFISTESVSSLAFGVPS